MANVIKHKRGSGSDPVASDLVVGEVAIRTDVGKLFTKMDNGSVAEIAGGGSDIAINTLSASSGTGGGSATFNGSAFRFTLSAPPSVSAQQLLVSINGVIQKPVPGTGQPSEGFSVDGTDIILGDAPEAGSDFFIITFKSLGVSEPADNSVTSAKIADGAIVNADINASAAIAGSKISPAFTSDISITNTSPTISFVDSNHNPDFMIRNADGALIFNDTTNQANRLVINTDGHIDVTGNLDVGSGLDVTGAITGTGDLTIDTDTLHVDSSNNRVGIGTTSPSGGKLHIAHGNEFGLFTSGPFNFQAKFESTDAEAAIVIEDVNSTTDYNRIGVIGNEMQFIVNNSPALHIDSSQRLLVGTTTLIVTGTERPLQIQNTGGPKIALGRNDDSISDGNTIGGIEFYGNDFDQGFVNTASIIVNAAGTHNNNDKPTRMQFFTTSDNASSSTERMRINPSGFVCIGTDDDIIFNHGATGDDGVVFDPAGTIQATRTSDQCMILNRRGTDGTILSFHNDGVCVGYVGFSGGTTTYSPNCSDRTLKKNFGDWTEDTLSLFKDLTPQTFNFLTEQDNDTKHKGFIAQNEVDKFPEAYPKIRDDKYWFDPMAMVPYLMKALQEAVARIEALEAK